MPLLNFRFPPAGDFVTRPQTVDEREFWERVYHGGRFINEDVSLVRHCDYIITPHFMRSSDWERLATAFGCTLQDLYTAYEAYTGHRYPGTVKYQRHYEIEELPLPG